MNRVISRAIWIALTALSSTELASASITVRLTPGVSTAAVGSTVIWTAQATDSANPQATFLYQFSVGSSASTLQVRRDFSGVNEFPWTEADQEGTYDIQVVAKESLSSSASAVAAETFTITSRVSGSSPVASATGHPLVALYSAPPCRAGASAQVQFRRTAGTYWWVTPLKPCNGKTSMNFYVGGMRPSTEYLLQGYVYNGGTTTANPPVTFTTGAVPSSITIENWNISRPERITSQPITLSSPTQGVPFATDSVSTIMWYLPAYQNTGGFLTRPVPGGTFLGIADDNSGIPGNHRLLREYDLAGNLVRETNTAAISAQLKARGTDPITSIHHEAFRFPNGDTGLIGSVEKVTNQGSGTVDVLGDMAIVLDSDLRVKFSWNEFDHLNIMNQAFCMKPANRGIPGARICISLVIRWPTIGLTRIRSLRLRTEI